MSLIFLLWREVPVALENQAEEAASIFPVLLEEETVGLESTGEALT
jgi:hypothetical protein